MKLLLVSCLGLFLTGCATLAPETAPEAPAAAKDRHTLTTDYQIAFQAVEQTLEKEGYTIEEALRESGTITTGMRTAGKTGRYAVTAALARADKSVEVQLTAAYPPQGTPVFDDVRRDELYTGLFAKIDERVKAIERQNREYNITIKEDGIAQYTTILMHDNIIISDCALEVNACKHIDKDKNVRFQLNLLLTGESPVFIEPEASMTVLLDGTRKFMLKQSAFRTQKLLDNNIFGNYMVYRYDVSAATLRQIAEARTVKIRINGRCCISGEFNEMNFRNFKRFYSEYVAR